MATPTVTSSTNSQMHNNIMAAGSMDRPPMLAIGRYPQWRSRFLRYIDTRPNVAATDDSPVIPEHTTVEIPMNMSPANKAHFKAEKEAIHLILTGIRDEIHSTVDACQIAQKMWEAIKRLQQGESLNIQDVKTNLFWEFRKFTSHDGETMESYYIKFYKLMNEMIRNNLTIATIGPYKPTTVLVQAVAATDDSPAIPEHTIVETPMNMSPANKAHFKAEKEAIHLILIGIGDEIYSTVDAYQTAQKMWEAIERLQQGNFLPEIPSTKTKRRSSKVDKTQLTLKTKRKNLETKRKF
nr:hypothetical protein [Tanacetum cinerariifolium]